MKFDSTMSSLSTSNSCFRNDRSVLSLLCYLSGCPLFVCLIGWRIRLPIAWPKCFSIRCCSRPLNWPRTCSPSMKLTAYSVWIIRQLLLVHWACCCRHSSFANYPKMWRCAREWSNKFFTDARGIVSMQSSNRSSCCPFSGHRRCFEWKVLASLTARWKCSCR